MDRPECLSYRSVFSDFASYTGGQVAHHIIELLFGRTRRAEIGATTTYRLVRLGVSTTELAGRADIDAPAAEAAFFRFSIEGGSDGAVFTASAEADRSRHHLLRTHPYTKSAKYAVLMFLPEALLLNVVESGKILNGFRLRGGASSNSRIIFRARNTRLEEVRMTIPSSAGWVQEVTSFAFAPSPTSTTHNRHAPYEGSESTWQRVGIGIPKKFATSKIVIPESTETAIPLIFKLIIGLAPLSEPVPVPYGDIFQ